MIVSLCVHVHAREVKKPQICVLACNKYAHTPLKNILWPQQLHECICTCMMKSFLPTSLSFCRKSHLWSVEGISLFLSYSRLIFISLICNSSLLLCIFWLELACIYGNEYHHHHHDDATLNCPINLHKWPFLSILSQSFVCVLCYQI